MKIFLKLLVCISLISGLLPILSNAKTSTNDFQCFKHNIQLQLADGGGFLVDGTEFWVTVDVIKQGNLVTIQFPVINFQTGQVSAEDPYAATGGFIYTTDGFLPEDIRPTDLVYRSIIAASNNGQSLPFSFAQDPATLPVPPVGYIFSVTSSGAITIQCAGTLGNEIANGPQILMPCSITYIVKPSVSLCTNYIIDPGFTNTTQFTNPNAANDGVRDLHVNDAYDGVVAFAWTSNANIADKTNGTLNAFVAVGQINSNGTLSMGAPVQLTNLPLNIMALDTAVAIDRNNKNNIVVSYVIVDNVPITNPNSLLGPPCRAVSFDGGKTWPAPYEFTAVVGSIAGTILTVTDVIYGSLAVGDTIYAYDSSPGIVAGTTITAFGPDTTGGLGTYTVDISQPAPVPSTNIIASPQLNGILPILMSTAIIAGDNRGVSADTFGNIWYSSTNGFNTTGTFAALNQPIFAASSDGGVTFPVVYTVPLPDPTQFPLGTFVFDFPQYCFGQYCPEPDGVCNYGLWFVCDFINLETDDLSQQIGFIPINGLGSFGTLQTVQLTSLPNTNAVSNITASADGRVWWQGNPAQPEGSFIVPQLVNFKSPGALAENIVGPWNTLISNLSGGYFDDPSTISQPVRGYSTSPQSVIYDDARQALYAIGAFQSPDFAQNMRLVLLISRDNGQTWSDPIDIATTDFANRGFQSMALDPVTGNLVFGWYDGRNDPTYESIQYFGAIVPAAQLDALVNRIPLSNPLYQIPPATGIIGTGPVG